MDSGEPNIRQLEPDRTFPATSRPVALRRRLPTSLSALSVLAVVCVRGRSMASTTRDAWTASSTGRRHVPGTAGLGRRISVLYLDSATAEEEANVSEYCVTLVRAFTALPSCARCSGKQPPQRSHRRVKVRGVLWLQPVCDVFEHPPSPVKMGTPPYLVFLVGQHP
jgi:hypothetical protein